MNMPALALAGGFTRAWARLYTVGLPSRTGEQRRAEIESDLWEHAVSAGEAGEPPSAVAGQIFGRVVLGMPADMAWHLSELRGDDMQVSVGQKAIVGVFAVLGILTVFFGISILVTGITDGWLFEDLDDTVLAFFTTLSIPGPLVAGAGVYVLRRARAEGRSPTRGRAMIVVGTSGIALLAAVMWWTVVGPVIALAIVIYWAWKIRGWSGGQPAIS